MGLWGGVGWAEGKGGGAEVGRRWMELVEGQGPDQKGPSLSLFFFISPKTQGREVITESGQGDSTDLQLGNLTQDNRWAGPAGRPLGRLALVWWVQVEAEVRRWMTRTW